MIRIFAVFICTFLLSSCALMHKKPLLIDRFIKKINFKSSDPVSNIFIPDSEKNDSWEDPINFVNSKQYNFRLLNDLYKFKTHEFCKSNFIFTDPVIGGGKIFIITRDGFIKAYDFKSYKLLWSSRIGHGRGDLKS